MADRYRVLNGGVSANWNDITYWSATSGGLGGASVPTSTDATFFDANSFLVLTGTVTRNVDANCLSMDWTGATNNPTFDCSSAHDIGVYGPLTLISTLSWTPNSAGTLSFQPLSAAALTANSCVIGSTIYFNANGFTQSLGSALVTAAGCNIIWNNTLTFTTANFDITCGGAITKNLTNSATSITLGSSIITCTAWTPLIITLDAGTSSIRITGTGAFSGGGKTYYEVQLNGTAHTISGNNTFTNLIFKADTTQTITFTDGSTQTITTPTITGSVGKVKTLQGSGTGGWTIAKAGGGTVTCSYMSISRSTGSPANTWYVNDKTSVNGGFNTGWIFPSSGNIIPRLIAGGLL
jgi:hypothetical protein